MMKNIISNVLNTIIKDALVDMPEKPRLKLRIEKWDRRRKCWCAIYEYDIDEEMQIKVEEFVESEDN
jgi:hypothetical protein